MAHATDDSDARTYVLVHGAWHGGWCWRRVADRLQAAGHRVFAPTQTGLGERVHLARPAATVDLFAEDIVRVIDAEELHDVILVGHSFGGRPISLVADRIPERLRHLVYLDAGVPESGKSHLDGMSPDVRAARISAAQAFDGGVSLPPPAPAELGVFDPRDAAWLVRRLTPHPFSTFTAPIHLTAPVGNGLAATYIRCTDPAYGPMAASAARAKATPGWAYLELATGHDAMVTKPGELVAMLLAIA